MYWGIPGLYDFKKKEKRRGRKTKEDRYPFVKDYYLYDPTGQKRHFGPISPNNDKGVDHCQEYDTRSYDEQFEKSP